MSIADYSMTAADNSANGWTEGMMPSAVNDVGRQMMADIRSMYNELPWIRYRDGTPGGAVSYISGTSFKISGNDCTARYQQGYRIRARGTLTGDIVGTIVSSSYSSPDTTVVVSWDSGEIKNEALLILISAVDTQAVPQGAAGANDIDTSGYYTLPGGLIVQWGVSSQVGHDLSVNFPIQFPTACLVVAPSLKFSDSSTIDLIVHYQDVTTSGFQQTVMDSTGLQFAGPTTLAAYTYIALGY